MKTIFIILLVSSVNLYSQTLVGYWPFTGNTADSSGMGNHGTIVGSVTLTTDRCGNPNSAYLFNGGKINIGNNGFPTGNNQRTLCAWFKRSAVSWSGDQNIFGYGDNSVNGCRNYLFMGRPDSLGIGNENRNAINVFQWQPDTSWHFLAAVFPQGATQTGQFLIYYDGNLMSDSSFLSTTLLNTNTLSPTIGCLGTIDGYFFYGKIDDVRLYSTALNSSQIAQLYGTPTAPVLTSPANNSSGISLTPLLDWNVSPGASSYRVRLSSDSTFAVTQIDTVINADSLRVPSGRLTNNVKYYWKVRATACASNSLYSANYNFTTSLVGIHPIGNEIPKEFSLSQNYPNPFNPTTNFEFRIADFGFVNLTIYDIVSKEVTTLVNGNLKPGTYKADWDASNYPSGVYFYKLTSGDFSETKRMVLIK